MSTRTARPPARRGSSPIPQPLGVLPRRQLTGVGPAVVVLAAAVALTGLNLQVHFTDAIGWVWAAAIVLAGMLAASGIRAFQRQGRLDPGIEAVLPLLGAQRPSRELVRVTRWSRGWVGVPARVTIRYAAYVDDSDPNRDSARTQQKGFLEQVVAGFSRRMGEDYQVRKHLPRKCMIQLELAPPVTPVSREQQRAEQVVKTMLGESAAVDVELGAGGEVRRIKVKHDRGPQMSIAARRAGIEKVVSSMLPGRWRAQWDLEGDAVTFEIRPPLPDLVLHEPNPTTKELTHAEYKSFKVPIGPDEDGHTQYWHPAVSPHCLVIGGTGSGKTSFQHTALTHLSQALWRVWVLDGKRIEFAGYREWSNVELVAARVEHQVRMLHAAHELMEQRYTKLENGTARLEDFEPLAVIIDEYATFKARVLRWYPTVKPKGAPTKPPVLELLPDLARLARSAKIHILLGIQRPDVEFLGGEMRDNFGARLSLGRLSPQGAMMMWDSPAIGVALPRNKRGRGVTLNAESVPVEVQTFYTPDPAKLDAGDTSEWQHLELLKPQRVAYPRMMIREAQGMLSDDDELEPDYFDWAAAKITGWDPTADTDIPVRTERRLPSNVVALGARSSVRFPPDPDVVEEAPDDDLDGYGGLQEGNAGDLAAGDLLLADPGLDVWVVVESVEPDVVDDEALAVEYRDLESGEEGLLTVSDAELLTFRRPQERKG